jgi:hypothetical protein
MPEWLERELAGSLAPVDAPDALRDRTFRPAVTMPARRVSVFLIAAAMVLLTAGTMWLSSAQSSQASARRWSPANRVQLNDHACILCHTT